MQTFQRDIKVHDYCYYLCVNYSHVSIYRDTASYWPDVHNTAFVEFFHFKIIVVEMSPKSFSCTFCLTRLCSYFINIVI